MPALPAALPASPVVFLSSLIIFLLSFVYDPRHACHLLVSSQNHDMKRLYVEDFVHTFARRCQVNCVYEDVPSDADRRKVLEE